MSSLTLLPSSLCSLVSGFFVVATFAGPVVNARQNFAASVACGANRRTDGLEYLENCVKTKCR